jgi:phospholipid/cholesterol/gamma-HCH transport system substrate-binding protein
MITPGTPDSKPLIAKIAGDIPTINAAPGGSGSLFEAAPEVLNNVNSVLRRVDELVAHNEQLVRDTLKNVESFTRELEQNKDKISAFIDDAGKAARSISDTGDRLHRFLANNEKALDETVTSIARTSKNAEKFTTTLAAKDKDIAKIIDNVRDISEQFKGVAAKLETTLDGLSGFLGDENGQSAVTEISEAARSFKELAAKLDRSFGDSSKGMARFAKGGLAEFEQLMRDARRMVRTMDRVMDSIGRNPQGLLFGTKQVREYKAN